jgi:hypothetical protein
MSIQVLDHLIIGRNRYYSFADQGLIRKWEIEFGQGPEIILKTLGEGLVESRQQTVLRDRVKRRDGDAATSADNREESSEVRGQRSEDRYLCISKSEIRNPKSEI